MTSLHGSHAVTVALLLFAAVCLTVGVAKLRPLILALGLLAMVGAWWAYLAPAPWVIR